MREKNTRHGFTQSDMVASIAIVACIVVFVILGSGACIPVHPGHREKERKVICMLNMRDIGRAISMYMTDHREVAPTRGLDLSVGSDNLRALGSLSLLYDSYVKGLKVFACPSTADRPWDPSVGLSIDPATGGLITARPAGCSYGYDSQKEPPTDPAVAIAADKPSPTNRLANSPNHRNTGQNVLFFDGHVEWGPTRNVGLNNDDIWHSMAIKRPLGYTDSYITQ